MNRKLRRLLQKAVELIEEQDKYIAVDMLPAGQALIDQIKATLSQQAEPIAQCDCKGLCEQRGLASDEVDATCKAVHDATAEAEPAPAQDEREAFIAAASQHRVEGSGFTLDVTSAGTYRNVETRMLYEGWKLARANRPAQTEQRPTVKHSLTVQPMAYAVFAENGNVVCFSTRRDHPSLAELEEEGKVVVALAPIAQTELVEKLRRVITELKNGFVVCKQCGEQEDTATLDCVSELEKIAAALAAQGGEA